MIILHFGLFIKFYFFVDIPLDVEYLRKKPLQMAYVVSTLSKLQKILNKNNYKQTLNW